MLVVSNFVRVGCEILLILIVIYVKIFNWRFSRFCNFVKVGYEILFVLIFMYMKIFIGDIVELVVLLV